MVFHGFQIPGQDRNQHKNQALFLSASGCPSNPTSLLLSFIFIDARHDPCFRFRLLFRVVSSSEHCFSLRTREGNLRGPIVLKGLPSPCLSIYPVSHGKTIVGRPWAKQSSFDFLQSCLLFLKRKAQKFSSLSLSLSLFLWLLLRKSSSRNSPLFLFHGNIFLW